MRRRPEPPAPDTGDPKCEKNIRRAAVPKHIDGTEISVVLDFKDITDFTTLFIADVLHDHFMEHDEKDKTRPRIMTINKDVLRRICSAVQAGIGGKSRWGNIEDAIYSSIETKLMECGWSETNTTITGFEIKLFESYKRACRETEINGLPDGAMFAADACQMGDEPRLACSMYATAQQDKKSILTLATRTDPGFRNHVDSGYCSNKHVPDYIFVDLNVQLRVNDGIAPPKDFMNSRWKIINGGFVNIMSNYAGGPKILDSDIIDKGVMSKTLNTGNFKLAKTFYKLLSRFNGDFGQIMYIAALSELSTRDNVPAELRVGNPTLISRDRLLRLISVMLTGKSVYGSRRRKQQEQLVICTRRASLVLPTMTVNYQNKPQPPL
jgi:hypothetical protein